MSGIRDILEGLRKENRLRMIPSTPAQGTLDLSSNDYLSLGSHGAEWREEFFDLYPDALFSSSASRLLSAQQTYHTMLEDRLEGLYGRPSLLFNSGYHANVGCIGALTIPSTLFVADKLIHASMVDGLRMAGSEFRRFPHNDIDKLLRILEKEAGSYERIVVLVESIYSMDGDEAPLRRLVEIKSLFPGMMLYVDEAHAFGVRGPRGLGLAEELGLTDSIDLLLGTLGKAAASAGAFAICSEEMKSLLINCARPFIFSTALPPVNAAWSHFMIGKIIGMTESRRHLAEISRLFSRRIEEISSRPTGSTSQIIPYLTGDAAKALAIAARLREAGVIALPIRRPTVPPGGERIRFSLGADMKADQFDTTFKILEETAHEI